MRVANIFWFLFIFSLPLFGDIAPMEWAGQFAMNHDGHAGTLLISEAKTGCHSPAWCDLRISYKDATGKPLLARILTLDQNGQRLIFVVNFPGNTQRFEVYLFSWDKTKMAGTTVWQGRTFGVLATREGSAGGGLSSIHALDKMAVHENKMIASSQMAASAGSCTHPAGTPQKSLTPQGIVELRYPDGTIKTSVKCGYNTTCPDGRKIPAQCTMMQAPPPTFPPLPNDASTQTWLKEHNQALMAILGELLGNDQGSIANYKKNYENGSVSLYSQMYSRTTVISELATSH